MPKSQQSWVRSQLPQAQCMESAPAKDCSTYQYFKNLSHDFSFEKDCAIVLHWKKDGAIVLHWKKYGAIVLSLEKDGAIVLHWKKDGACVLHWKKRWHHCSSLEKRRRHCSAIEKDVGIVCTRKKVGPLFCTGKMCYHYFALEKRRPYNPKKVALQSENDSAKFPKRRRCRGSRLRCTGEFM